MFLEKVFILMCSWRTYIMEAQELLVCLSNWHWLSVECFWHGRENLSQAGCCPCLLQHSISLLSCWCYAKYVQLRKLCLRTALKIHGVMPPNRNHRKTVSAKINSFLFYPIAIFTQVRTCFALCTNRSPTTHAVPSYIMNCSNCGHGTDLRGCPQSPFQIKGTIKKNIVLESLLRLNNNGWFWYFF